MQDSLPGFSAHSLRKTTRDCVYLTGPIHFQGVIADQQLLTSYSVLNE